MRKAKLLMLFAMFVFTVNTVFAGSFTSTDSTFDSTLQKQIHIALPSDCASIDSILTVSNGTLLSIQTDDPAKGVELNTDNNKFIVYGMNDTLMTGDLIVNVQPLNNDKLIVSLTTSHGANSEAEAIAIDDFSLELTSFLDLNADGVLDSNDVVLCIQNIFNDDMTIVALQRIINACIEEM